MQGDLETGDPMGQHGEWSFITYFCIAWGQRWLSDANRHFLGKRSVSLTTYHLLGPPAVCPSVHQFYTFLGLRNPLTRSLATLTIR
jgi:hypothetical protein